MKLSDFFLVPRALTPALSQREREKSSARTWGFGASVMPGTFMSALITAHAFIEAMFCSLSLWERVGVRERRLRLIANHKSS
jgi:hypothetical protein